MCMITFTPITRFQISAYAHVCPCTHNYSFFCWCASRPSLNAFVYEVCANVPGYQLTVDVDHSFDDIFCDWVSTQQAAAACNANSTCKSINTFSVDGSIMSCAKTVASPVVRSVGICYYQKVTTSKRKPVT